MRMTDESVIATRELLVKTRANGEMHKLLIRVGRPRWREDGLAECPVEWDGLIPAQSLSSAPGHDLLHALYLASNADEAIRALSAKYDFFWPTGESYFDD